MLSSDGAALREELGERAMYTMRSVRVRGNAVICRLGTENVGVGYRESKVDGLSMNVLVRTKSFLVSLFACNQLHYSVPRS